MQHSILALADDLTGALEIGAKFSEHGLPATVITNFSSPPHHNGPVLVIDAETRHVSSHDAAASTRHALTVAQYHSPSIIYKKTDSTLRGNIAAELRAIQDVFPGQRIVYVPAYPDMGRTVKDGKLFVWGIPVHQTEFAHDRWNPIRDCTIHKILGDVSVTVLDGESNEDVEAAVHIILAESPPHVCAGPAALAGALAKHLSPAAAPDIRLPSVSRCLVVNGSLHSASIQQMVVAEENNIFDSRWMRLEANFQGSGRERALQIGDYVRRMLESSHFDALIVFGGDTAFGIHSALGALPFRSLGEIAPGVSVSQSVGLLWITKAGGFGSPDMLCTIRNRLT